jgi:hypothetical protein
MGHTSNRRRTLGRERAGLYGRALQTADPDRRDALLAKAAATELGGLREATLVQTARSRVARDVRDERSVIDREYRARQAAGAVALSAEPSRDDPAFWEGLAGVPDADDPCAAWGEYAEQAERSA